MMGASDSKPRPQAETGKYGDAGPSERAESVRGSVPSNHGRTADDSANLRNAPLTEQDQERKLGAYSRLAWQYDDVAVLQEQQQQQHDEQQNVAKQKDNNCVKDTSHAVCAGSVPEHQFVHAEQNAENTAAVNTSPTHGPAAAERPAMTIQQLIELIDKRVSPQRAQAVKWAFGIWASGCSKSDTSYLDVEVSGLLHRPHQFLQHLSSQKANNGSGYFWKTASQYLDAVMQALKLPEVQRLLNSEQEVQQLLQQLQAAKDHLLAVRLVDDIADAAAAAAAAAASGRRQLPSPIVDLPHRSFSVVADGDRGVDALKNDESIQGDQHQLNKASSPPSRKRHMNPTANEYSNSEQPADHIPQNCAKRSGVRHQSPRAAAAAGAASSRPARKAAAAAAIAVERQLRQESFSSSDLYDDHDDHDDDSVADQEDHDHRHRSAQRSVSVEDRTRLEVLSANNGSGEACTAARLLPVSAAAAAVCHRPSEKRRKATQCQAHAQKRTRTAAVAAAAAAANCAPGSRDHDNLHLDESDQIDGSDHRDQHHDDDHDHRDGDQDVIRSVSVTPGVAQQRMLMNADEISCKKATAGGAAAACSHSGTSQHIPTAPGVMADECTSRLTNNATPLSQQQQQQQQPADLPANLSRMFHAQAAGGSADASRQEGPARSSTPQVPAAAAAAQGAAAVLQPCKAAALGGGATTNKHQPAAAAAAAADGTSGACCCWHSIAPVSDAAAAGTAAAHALEEQIADLLQQLSHELSKDGSTPLQIKQQAERFDYMALVLPEYAAELQSPVQLEAAAAVLSWLLLLPSGSCRELMIDMLRTTDGWLDKLIECWSAEVQLTGCTVQQAATAADHSYAADYTAGCATSSNTVANSSGRCIKGYLAGLCQMLLNLLGELCKASSDAAPADVVQQQVLKQAAEALLAGTRRIIQQQLPNHSRKASYWRDCLFLSYKQLKADSSSSRCQVRARLARVLQQQIQ